MFERAQESSVRTLTQELSLVYRLSFLPELQTLYQKRKGNQMTAIAS